MKLFRFELLCLLIIGFVCPLMAQQLEVEGDAKITGHLEIIQAEGDSSVFIGSMTGIHDDGDNRNVFIGNETGKENTSGDENVFIGNDAGKANTTGRNHTFIGSRAGEKMIGAYDCTFIGKRAGEKATERRNTFIGAGAGFSVTTGHSNTYIGVNSGVGNETGSDNVAIGDAPRFENDTERSVLLGTNAAIWGTDNAIAIGFQATADCNNCAVLGGTGDWAVKVGINTTAPNYSLDILHDNIPPSSAPGNGINLKNLGGNNHQWQMFVGDLTGKLSFYKNTNLMGTIDDVSGNYVPNSDKNLKKDIKTLKKQLPLIQQLRPTSYRFKKNSSRKVYGLIAQEVQEVLPDIVVVNEADNPEGEILGVSYTEFIPVLIAGIQELNTLVETKEEHIRQLENRLERIEKILEQPLISHTSTTGSSQNVQQALNLDSPTLEQNTPNPFDTTTKIRYYIPKGYQKATLQISNNWGQIVQITDLNKEGSGEVNVQFDQLSQGNYFYSLVLDGQIFSTKQMVLNNSDW